MTTYREGNSSELREAREMVYLAEVRNHLQVTHGAYGLELEIESVYSPYGSSRYIIATLTKDGVEVTSQNANNRGQHGHYIHPSNGLGTAEVVAAFIAADLRRYNVRKQEQRMAAEHA